jgi:hypothetical protein
MPFAKILNSKNSTSSFENAEEFEIPMGRREDKKQEQQKLSMDDGNCLQPRYIHQYNTVAPLFLQLGSLQPIEPSFKNNRATGDFLSGK